MYRHLVKEWLLLIQLFAIRFFFRTHMVPLKKNDVNLFKYRSIVREKSSNKYSNGGKKGMLGKWHASKIVVLPIA